MPILDTSKDLSALFSQQVRSTPTAVALEDNQNTYTYAELDYKVDTLASRLQSHGVARDSLVGVLLSRSADYVIACLAALRAGGAFLVLELAYPPDLLNDVVNDAQPAVVITQQNAIAKVKSGMPLVIIDEETADTNGHTDEDPLPAADDGLERLAFVAYSSGTTGKPKGIANPHRAAVLSYDARFAFQDVGPGDRIACNVFFVWEILRPLLRGATVIIVPDESSYDPATLVELLANKEITETLMTPTLLAAVLSRQMNVGHRLPALQTLWLNGEVVTTDLARRGIKALPQTRLLNVFSACETHEVAFGDIREMLDDHSIYCAVGPPLDPEHTYVVDENCQKVAEGATGELCVGGPMLARGYLNLAETTAHVFVADPFSTVKGARMYKTGDLARILPSGDIEITGRVEGMIKLRGYSVVPAKVESAIIKQLAVRDCAVIAHGEGLDRQLVAYVVGDKENGDCRPVVEIDESGYAPAARSTLSSSLAQYMIPALWVELDELPTHPVTGKADLKRLPRPTSPRPQVNGQKARPDPIGIDEVADIWAATLNTRSSVIGPTHSFFDLGGHSLLLAQLASRLSKAFEVRVPVARLADPSTLSGHVETLRSIRDGHTAAVQADLPAVLRADALLDEEIRPADAKMCSLSNAETVLLTGATGFLGAFLLNEILETTSARIICLVRCTEPSEDDIPSGIARIRKNMIDFGLWNDGIMERIEVLPGNLSGKRLGLPEDQFKGLASRIQVIVHAAATVNLVYPYAALRKANVGGTREILRLASQGNATVQYISTNGVLPPSQGGWPEEAMLGIEHVPERLLDGYGQTKWVAEQLVVEAGRRGLPVRILRAGTISGHSTTGAVNAWDLLNALIVESIRLGYFPEVQGWRAEMTPVDFVSKAIVHLGNQTHAKQLMFHLGDPDPVDIKHVFSDLKELGYPTEPMDFEKWVGLWNEKRGPLKGGDGAFTIDILRSGMPSIEFLKGIVVLNNASTRPFRAVVQRPKVDKILLETYTRHWHARGWLTHPPSRQQSVGGSAQLPRYGPLSGKVAVVLGASSGIGAAVCAALAKEGCHLALGARRINALEDIKRKLTVREGKVILRKTDVTDRLQVEALVKAAEDELGPIDILISCAGVMYFTMMHNTHVEEWERTVDVNCKGLLNCLSSTVPAMLKRGSGHIVAISSDAGRKVFPGLGVYSASKMFIEGTLQALRVETAGTGLRVTSIQPGNTFTDLLNMSSDQEAVKKYNEPSGSQILDPEDVANSIVYALRQSEHVSVNEVLIEPRDEPI